MGISRVEPSGDVEIREFLLFSLPPHVSQISKFQIFNVSAQNMLASNDCKNVQEEGIPLFLAFSLVYYLLAYYAGNSVKRSEERGGVGGVCVCEGSPCLLVCTEFMVNCDKVSLLVLVVPFRHEF